MSEDESSKLVIDLAEELSAYELELLRMQAAATNQSLAAYVIWVLLGREKSERVSIDRKEQSRVD